MERHCDICNKTIKTESKENYLRSATHIENGKSIENSDLFGIDLKLNYSSSILKLLLRIFYISSLDTRQNGMVL